MDNLVNIIMAFVDEFSPGFQAAVQNFQNGYNTMNNASKTVTGTMSSLWQGTVGKVTGYISGLVTHFKWASLFVGTALVGMTKSMMDTAAEAEQMKVSFSTLLGSDAKAGNLLEWLTKVSLQTPITRSDLSKTAQTFLAFGQDLDQTKKAVMAVTEATSALGISGTKLNTMTYSLGQIFNSTTVRATEFRELMLAGVPVAKLLGNAVKEGQLKLDGFGASAEGASGVTKKMTTAFNSATKQTQYASQELEILQLRLDKAKNAHTVNTATVKAAELAIQKFKDKQAAANSVINNYNDALGKSASANYANATAIDFNNEETLKQIREMNKGKDIAIALEDQMLKLYGGASLRQVKTFSGMLSNFSDVFQYVVQRAMGISLQGDVQIGGAFYNIRNAVASVIDFMTNNVSKIAEFFNAIFKHKESLYAFAGFLIGAFIPFIGGIVSGIAILGTAFAIIGVYIGKFIDSMGGIGEIITAVKGFFDSLKGPLQTAGTYIEAFGIIFFANVIKPFKEGLRFGEVLDQLSKFGNVDTSKLGKAFEPLTFLAKEVLPRIGTFLQTVFVPMWDNFVNQIAKSGEAFKNIGANLGGLGVIFGIFVTVALWPIIQTVILVMGVIGGLANSFSYLMGFFGGVLQFFNGFWQLIQGIFTLNFNLIATGFGNMVFGIWNVISNGLQFILAFIGGFVSTVINFFIGLWKALVGGSIIPDIVNGIITWITLLVTTVTNAILAFILGIIKFFTDMAKSVVDTITVLVDNVKTFFSGMITGVTSAVSSFISSLVGKFVSFKDTVVGVIGSMVSSIAGKFNDLVGQALSWGKGIISNMIQGIKDAVRAAGKLAGTLLSKMGINMEDLQKLQHGGVVAGPIGSPVPIIAHGGERIIPRNGVDVNGGGGTSLSINFYGGVVLDSEERVKSLADQVGKILGRQNELARYGVGI